LLLNGKFQSGPLSIWGGGGAVKKKKENDELSGANVGDKCAALSKTNILIFRLQNISRIQTQLH